MNHFKLLMLNLTEHSLGPTIKNNISYLTSDQAKLIDDELMNKDINYTIDQLMEIAGLSASMAIHDAIKNNSTFKNIKKVLNISGPGNNGGDGLVASRYLKEFGYEVDIYYPKSTNNELYLRLIKQCKEYSISFIEEFDPSTAKYDLIIDSIFGFSFKGEIRAPFVDIIKSIKSSNSKIASIDIPSGWDVNNGNIVGDTDTTFTPDILISLTLPKLCAFNYKGVHYLAGRFVPIKLFEKYNLKFPTYNESDMFKLL